MELFSWMKEQKQNKQEFNKYILNGNNSIALVMTKIEEHLVQTVVLRFLSKDNPGSFF